MEPRNTRNKRKGIKTKIQITEYTDENNEQVGVINQAPTPLFVILFILKILLILFISSCSSFDLFVLFSCVSRVSRFHSPLYFLYFSAVC